MSGKWFVKDKNTKISHLVEGWHRGSCKMIVTRDGDPVCVTFCGNPTWGIDNAKQIARLPELLTWEKDVYSAINEIKTLADLMLHTDDTPAIKRGIAAIVEHINCIDVA